MRHNREIIYIAGFLFTIPVALTSYINSSFLENYVSESAVGVIYAVSAIIAIFALVEAPKLLQAIGNRKTAILFTLIILLSFVLLAFGQNKMIVIGAFMSYFIITNLIVTNFDIFIEDFSGRGSIGSLRGFFMAILASAWVLAQVASGLIINQTSFRGIYLISALFVVLVLVVFSLSFRDFVDRQYKRVSLPELLKVFIKNKNISEVYFISLVLKFFYAWMVIYTPIYLNQHIGLPWNQIGLIFAVMLTPFVVLDFPLGRLSDKIGEKKMLIVGFGIIIVATLTIPLIGQSVAWVWALVLFCTRIGAATIETMSESYFFKNIQEENINILSFFRNTGPLSYVAAPIVATVALPLLPSFKYLFFVLAGVLFLGLLISFRIKDVK
jgi:MFS family permease